MPFQKITFKPGIDRQKSQLLNEGGWSDTQLVRFRDGEPQKYAGWAHILSSTFNGICRGLIAWAQLNGYQNVGIGTSTHYYLMQGSTLFDITPVDTTGTLAADPFTTAGNTTVTVAHTAHGRSVGDLVSYSGSTAINGVTPGTADAGSTNFGFYPVASVIDANSYTITTSATASGSSTGGGAVVVWTYLIPVGPSDAIFGAGWGAGNWGGNLIRASGTLVNPAFTTTNLSTTVTVASVAHGLTIGSRVIITGATAVATVTMNGTWSVLAVPTVDTFTFTAGSAANANATGGGAAAMYTYFQPGWGLANSASTIKTNSPRVWTHDNWGQDLAFAPRDGAVYYWAASGGVTSRGVTLKSLSADTNTPLQTRGVLIGLPERHLIAYGTDKGGSITYDPMLIHWSDVENLTGATAWTATATNSAGTFRLQGGTKIMGAKRTQAGILVFTDTTAYLQQFIGTPFVYGFFPQGENAGLISANAAADVNGTVYWMSPVGIYAWRGFIQKLEPTIFQDVFGNGSTAINRLQQEKIFCGLDINDNEITWFYPSNGGTGENDRYITHNITENLWYWGALPRTAYIDRGVFPNPIATDASGNLFFHEVGVDADGAAMSVSVTSGYIDLSSGDEFIAIDRIIPDFINLSGSVQLTFMSVQYPGGAVTTKGPYTITSSTKFIRSPIRGRQVAIKISSTAIGDFWRHGATRILTQPMGRR